MFRRLRFGRFAALVGLLLLLALVIQPLIAPADDVDPLEGFFADQRRIAEEKKDTIKDIAANKVKKSEYEREIMTLDAELVALSKEIDAAEAAIDALVVQIIDAKKAIADAIARLKERQTYLESRLCDIYVNGDITMLDVFFSAASFDEFIVLYDMVERIMVQDKEVLDAIAAELDLIEKKEAELQKAKDGEEFILAELETKNEELSHLQSAKTKAVNDLNMSITQLAAKYEALEAADKEVEELIKKELASRPKVAYFGGTFIWPLPSNYTSINSDYGMRFHPILKRNIMHTGIDLGAPGGTEIYAVGAGEIIFRGWLGGYGQAVMIDHGGGIVTLYAHMSRFGQYNEGDIVVQTNVIGYVGSTGQSTGNHLHFEVRKDGSHIDPHNDLGK